MTADRYQQVKAIFYEVLDSPPDTREAVLASRCMGDAEFETEIRRMLAEVDTPGLLDLPAVSRTEMQTVLEAVQRPSLVGKTLVGRFRIDQLLGSGGMGEVWAAFDQELGEQIAVKTIRPEIAADPKILLRFKQEVMNARRVTHPNVCRVFDFFVHTSPDGLVPFLTMQLLQGETLAERLRRERPTEELCLRILRDCAAALTSAHHEGLLHGDFKPGNVMLIPSEQGGHKALVTDFGLARHIAEECSELSAVGLAGTPGYMAPEQTETSKINASADTYALAVVACEMLTGLRPSEGGLECLPAKWKSGLRAALDPNPNRRGSPLRFVQAPRRRRFKIFSVIAFFILSVVATILSLLWDEPKSIAVLPFAVEAGVADDPYLGADISDEIIAALSRIPSLTVIARNSSTRFSASDQDLNQVAQKLRARYVVTGSIRSVGDRSQIATRLVDPLKNRILWSETFDCEGSQTTALLGQIVRGISARLGITVTTAQVSAFGVQIPPQKAIDRYVRGRSLWTSREPSNLHDALALFDEAVAIDSTFAAAYAARADTLAIMAERSYLSANSAVPQAKEAALHAIILDPQLPEAHAALGLVQGVCEWDFYNAEKSFQRAIQLGPSYVYSHQWYSALLLKTHEPERAIKEAKVAATLDPLSPAAIANVGWMNFYNRRFDEVIQTADILKRDYPQYPDVCMLRADAMLGKKQYKLSIQALSSCSPAMQRTPLYLMSYAIAQARSGDDSGAKDTLNRMLSMKNQRSVSESNLAAVYDSLDQLDEAFYWLDQGVISHDPLTALVDVSPFFSSVRGDSRYEMVLQRIGLNYKK